MSSSDVVVVGSGASGIHFALTALEQGARVTLVDVGRAAPPSVLPGDSLSRMKASLEDPVQYFLGDDFESLILPREDEDEYYGFPPSKSYVFDGQDELGYAADGFSPLVSFAAGGLAQAWTGGSYPFDDRDLEAFPFAYDTLGEHYDRIARRIGISGEADDMAEFFPVHDGLLPPLDLDEHSRRLLDRYAARRAWFHRAGVRLGRARLATLTREHEGRPACTRLGRCLWGCPTKALYTPSLSLEACRRHDRFDELSGWRARRFVTGGGGRVKGLVVRSEEDGREREIETKALALAAGTLSTARILLDSLHAETGRAEELTGLMDNRQVLMPFVNLGMIGRRFDPDSYQYHQLAIGLDRGGARDYVHGLVTTLKTALIHPVAQSLPFSLRTNLRFFRNIHAALGLVNINFSDQRRDENRIGLEPGREGGESRLLVHYRPAADEAGRIKRTCREFRRLLRKLGCLAPAGMTHVRPMGASVHYAGTVPLAGESKPLSVDANGRCRELENLWLADGSTFPELPAKNLTFTLMANADRMARAAFG